MRTVKKPYYAVVNSEGIVSVNFFGTDLPVICLRKKDTKPWLAMDKTRRIRRVYICPGDKEGT